MHLQLGTTIGSLLHHTAEIEYMFADWFFGKDIPKEIVKPSFLDLETLAELLSASNTHLLKAMKEEWHQTVMSRMGESRPLEVIGRFMYHTGMHAGQILFIRKNGQKQTES